MTAIKNLENWLIKFKNGYDALPDNQKENSQTLDNISSVNSVDSLWINNKRLDVNIQFHFFNVNESNKDFKVNINFIDSLDLDKLVDLIRVKWNLPLSEFGKSHYYGYEKYSDVVENVLVNGLHSFEQHLKNLIYRSTDGAPQIIRRTLIEHDLFCWVVIGKIQDLDVKNVIKSISRKDNDISSSVDENQNKNYIEGFGTYFFPPIWIGDYLTPSFKDKVINKPLIDFSKDTIRLFYKKKNLIIEQDGFIGIDESNKRIALKLLNEIMATAIFLEIPVLQINESELAEIKINKEDFSIQSWHVSINSMRTKLFDDIFNEPSSTMDLERENLTKSDLIKLCDTAMQLTSDITFTNFLSFYLESVTMLKNYSYAQSFVISWLIIERYLSLLWKDEVVDKIEELDRKDKYRKDNLKNHGRWSVYYIIETLNLLGIIETTENYKTLMSLKRKRDAIVHKGEKCSKKEAEGCLKIAQICFKKGLKSDKHHEIILESLKTTLTINNVDFNKIITDFGQVEAADKRDKGRKFSFNEHLKALIYSLLSNQRRWIDIVDKVPKINEVFFNFDSDKLENYDTEDLLNEIKKIKVGNISINKQIAALPHNIRQLKKIEKDFGSLDIFVTHDSPSKVVKLLSKASSEYKIKQMGDALALEYLKSVGVRGMKPDVHIKRICGHERLDIIPPKDTQKQLEAFKNFAESVNVSETYLDNLIWIFGADGFGEICTENPNCHKCQLTNYCNYSMK